MRCCDECIWQDECIEYSPGGICVRGADGPGSGYVGDSDEYEDLDGDDGIDDFDYEDDI